MSADAPTPRARGPRRAGDAAAREVGARAFVRACCVSLALGLALGAPRATRADSGVRPLPSFRLSAGAASVERGERMPGFTGHLSAGLGVANFGGAGEDAGTNLFGLVVDAAAWLSPWGGRADPGFVARLGLGYDRTGPGGLAARNFSLTLEAGYGTPWIHATIGLGYLTGRVAGLRDRGVRAQLTLLLVGESVYLQTTYDVWPGGTRTENDARFLAGLDLGAFMWSVFGER